MSLLNSSNYKLNEPLSAHTTVRIGGPADIWYDAKSTEDFVNTIKLAREHSIPVTVLGRGANTLIGDKGIRGLVIKNSSKQIQIGQESIREEEIEKTESEDQIVARWEAAGETEGARKMYDFKDLDYDESSLPRIEVTIDSGVDMPFAVNYTIDRGLTGLQWYARIPGTCGGWIHNNVHGGSHFINEVLISVRVLTPNNEIVTFSKKDLGLGYDQSRFHDSQEIILDAVFELYQGDAAKAKYVAMEWAKRKSIQPGVSVGCIFQNISAEQKIEHNYPTTSAGYIIEHVLKMTDFRIGDAKVSAQHHNFVENMGHATAKDYRAVIEEIQKRTRELTGIELKTEIFYLGEF